MADEVRFHPGDPQTGRNTPTPCPACGHTMDAFSDGYLGDLERLPQDGDWSVCFNCLSPTRIIIDSFGYRHRLLNELELELFMERHGDHLEQLARMKEATKDHG